MGYRVRFVKPDEHYRRYKQEFDSTLLGCLERGDLINRQQLRDFERELADYVGTKYAVGVNSGYHALAFSLLAAGVGNGDEVVTVAHTFVATVSAIVHCGAKPVLVEVGPDYNMDVESLRSKITDRTRAIIPVHLNGRICNMKLVMELAEERNVAVIEDACQSLGAKYAGQRAGSFGLTGCWSFYPFKILGSFGDGGAVTTNDPDIAKAVSRLRYNGEDRETGEYHYHGYTALLDNIQAAVLSAKLKHFDEWIEHRRHIAGMYAQELEGVGDLILPHYPGEDFHDVFQNYVIRSKRRDDLRTHLTEKGVETLVSWPKPMWEHGALAIQNPNLPETEAICREVISLPMSQETTKEEVEIVSEAVRAFF